MISTNRLSYSGLWTRIHWAVELMSTVKNVVVQLTTSLLSCQLRDRAMRHTWRTTLGRRGRGRDFWVSRGRLGSSVRDCTYDPARTKHRSMLGLRLITDWRARSIIVHFQHSSETLRNGPINAVRGSSDS
jgi:hypothetical protein